jgi:hypothetical protein
VPPEGLRHNNTGFAKRSETLSNLRSDQNLSSRSRCADGRMHIVNLASISAYYTRPHTKSGIRDLYEIGGIRDLYEIGTPSAVLGCCCRPSIHCLGSYAWRLEILAGFMCHVFICIISLRAVQEICGT